MPNFTKKILIFVISFWINRLVNGYQYPSSKIVQQNPESLASLESTEEENVGLMWLRFLGEVPRETRRSEYRNVWLEKEKQDFLLGCHGPSGDLRFSWYLKSNQENLPVDWSDIVAVMNSSRHTSLTYQSPCSSNWTVYRGKCRKQLNLATLGALAAKKGGGNWGVIFISCRVHGSDESDNFATFVKCGDDTSQWLKVHKKNGTSWTNENNSCDSIELALDGKSGTCVCKAGSESFQPKLVTCGDQNLADCQTSIIKEYSEQRLNWISWNKCPISTKFDKKVITDFNNFSKPGMVLCQKSVGSLMVAYAPFLPAYAVEDGDMHLETNFAPEILHPNISAYGNYLKFTTKPIDPTIWMWTGNSYKCIGPRFLFSGSPGGHLKWFRSHDANGGDSSPKSKRQLQMTEREIKSQMKSLEGSRSQNPENVSFLPDMDPSDRFNGIKRRTVICEGVVKISNLSSKTQDYTVRNMYTIPGKEESPSLWTIVAIVAGSLAVTLFVLLICLLLLYRKMWAGVRDLTDEEVKEFLNGNNSQLEKDSENMAFFLPYNTQLEIPMENIEIDEMSVLGCGEFGKVFKGQVEGQVVAIKALKEYADVTHFKSHLSELKIMSFVGHHDHIVQLLGASTAQIKKRKVYLIYEFCVYGNLLNFIKERRQIFVDQLENDQYKPIERVVRYENASTKKLCSFDLIRWAFEMASGMEYVASLKIYHGDLALRNILLTDDLVAKIGDFGLSKQLQAQYAIYVQRKECPLPLKWLALESLRDLEFSIQSDVWAFGVCLWELFSLGAIPYPCILDFNFEAWNLLNEGHRMERPLAASTQIYGLMLQCWNARPMGRPSFTDLKEKLALQLTNFGKS